MKSDFHPRRRKRKYGKNGKGREGDTTSGTGSPRRNKKTTSSADV